jgi:hypothetical protein
MNSPFTDSRTSGLLSRVREDIALLRQDVGHLVQHTTRHTLPDSARGLADQARHRLAAGGSYAATRLRSLRESPPRQAIGIVGGALLVGLLAAGAYALCKGGCCQSAGCENDESSGEPADEPV